MFRLPHTPVMVAGWVVLWWVAASVALAVVKAAHGAWRRRRFTESVRIIPRPPVAPPRPVPPPPIRFDHDPSPKPRREEPAT